MNFEPHAALKSKKEEKDVEGSNHEAAIDVPAIEFMSANSPTVPRSMQTHSLPRDGLHSR